MNQPDFILTTRINRNAKSTRSKFVDNITTLTFDATYVILEIYDGSRKKETLAIDKEQFFHAIYQHATLNGMKSLDDLMRGHK